MYLGVGAGATGNVSGAGVGTVSAAGCMGDAGAVVVDGAGPDEKSVENIRLMAEGGSAGAGVAVGTEAAAVGVDTAGGFSIVVSDGTASEGAVAAVKVVSSVELEGCSKPERLFGSCPG